MLETDGEIYLSTPEHKIPFYSRLLIDVHALLLLCAAAGGTALYLGTRFVVDTLHATSFKPFTGARWVAAMVLGVAIAAAAGLVFVTGNKASFT